MRTGAHLLSLRAGAVLLTLGLGLAACDTVTGPPGLAPQPRPAPDVTQVPVDADPSAARSAASRALERHYARVQSDLLAQGRLRRDSGAPAAKPGPARLAETFLSVALFEEGGLTSASARETRLRKWAAPVRLAIHFGETVPEAQRAADTRTLRAYAGRLARATRHPVSVSDGPANFHVFVLNEDDRSTALPRLRAAMPELDAASLRDIRTLPRSVLCIVYAQTEPATGALRRAIAIVRGEHPDLLRTSCLHEEIAQGLGLLNDSDAARPSIFNDDEEFALLTEHDTRLLRMLYDPRFRPGMTLAQARPVAYAIAAELSGGAS